MGLLPRIILLLSILNIPACNFKNEREECFTTEHIENLIYQLQTDRGRSARYREIYVQYPGNGHYTIDVWATSNRDTGHLRHRLFDHKKYGHTWYGYETIPYPGAQITFTLEDTKMMSGVHAMAEMCRKKVNTIIGENHSIHSFPASLSITIADPTFRDRMRYRFIFKNAHTDEEYQFEFNSGFKLLIEGQGLPSFMSNYLN